MAERKRKETEELEAADKIIKLLSEALDEQQFHFHVAKLKESSCGNASEELIAKKLEAIDTKRLLEAITALEKVFNMKKKLLQASSKTEVKIQTKNSGGKIMLPPIEIPQETCRETVGGKDYQYQ